MIKVHGITAFTDNYIWCIYDDELNRAVVVDPGDHKSTQKFLSEHNLSLDAILVTHHHPDHTAGINKLKEEYNCVCITSTESKVIHSDAKLSENETIKLLGLEFSAIDVPGHTLDHNAYYCEHLSSLFCGDTLFSGGCGRLFEGSAEQMFQSLQKLSQLPLETQIYCAHEYTLANLEFASSLMPSNQDLIQYTNQATHNREQGIPTIPTTLSTEKKINPFLRSDDVELIQHIKKLNPETISSAVSIFAATRQAKDSF